MESEVLFLLLGALAAAMCLFWRSRSSNPLSEPPLVAEKERPHGGEFDTRYSSSKLNLMTTCLLPAEWPPVDYNYPSISPLHPPSFDLSAVDPIPYRPFRHNSYPINMGIRPLPVDNWIQLDSQ